MRPLPAILWLSACGVTAPAEPPGPAPTPAWVEAFPVAPSLDGAVPLHGELPDLAGNELVLVEWWATWCGPCVTAIPHLAELRAADPELRVVHVSTEGEARQQAFLARRTDIADLDFALAAPQARDAWFAHSGTGMLPQSFLVHHGRLLWTGHPTDVDRVLARVRDGAWSPEAADAQEAVRMRSYAEIAAEIGHARAQAQMRAEGDEYGWDAEGEQRLAQYILDHVPAPERDLLFASDLAEEASVATDQQSCAAEATLGAVRFALGDVEGAVAAQRRAARLCGPEAWQVHSDLAWYERRLGDEPAPSR